MQNRNFHRNNPQEGQLDANGQPIVLRVRTPRGREVIGVIEQRVGAGRMLIKCFDGKTRNCRIPGRMKKKLWLREGDIVLVEPWELDDEKGDVIFKYSPTAVQWLQKNGFMKEVTGEF